LQPYQFRVEDSARVTLARRLIRMDSNWNSLGRFVQKISDSCLYVGFA